MPTLTFKLMDMEKIFEWNDKTVIELINFMAGYEHGYPPQETIIEQFKASKYSRQSVTDFRKANQLDVFGNWYQFKTLLPIPQEQYEVVRKAIEGSINQPALPEGVSLHTYSPFTVNTPNGVGYEILTYINPKGEIERVSWYAEINYPIHSVKRKRDGEVFKLGDWVVENCTGKNHVWVIKEFSTKDTRCFAGGINIDNIEKENKASLQKTPHTDTVVDKKPEQIHFTKEQLNAMMENVWNAAREMASPYVGRSYFRKDFKSYWESLPENKINNK